jgi:hypothetical protein
MHSEKWRNRAALKSVLWDGGSSLVYKPKNISHWIIKDGTGGRGRADELKSNIISLLLPSNHHHFWVPFPFLLFASPAESLGCCSRGCYNWKS